MEIITMKTYVDCVPCFISQAIALARHFAKNDVIEEQIVRKVLKILEEFDYSLPPPRIAYEVYPAMYKILNDPDPYREIKHLYNQKVLDLYPRLKQLLDNSEDRFRTVVKLALAGNIIDFGSGTSFSLEKTLERVLKTEPTIDEIELLFSEIKNASTIFYLADNSGEIGLDKLLIEELLPHAKVILGVRGGPTINDVTIEDAREVGLTDIVEVIDPGITLPGIWLEASSSRFQEVFKTADVIISKGQGNFETLNTRKEFPIFFLFMVKCDVVAKNTGLKIGDQMVAKVTSLNQIP